VNSGRFRENTDCSLVLEPGSFDNGPPSLRLSLVEGIESFRRLPVAREYLPALNRAKLLQRSSVLGRRHARGSPERAGEARLRGKLAIEGDLRER
jgi:hypothetical protein